MSSSSALLVQKYGGTSVGSVERIEAVADRVARHRAAGDRVAVVVSAMSGETNRLLALAEGISDAPEGRELDVLLAAGEQVSVALTAMALEKRGIPARSWLADQIRIRTDARYNRSRIEEIETERLQAELDAGSVPVVAGFQGVDADGNITTLGRGGSDTTAVALAAALGADECQIYTDVDGVYTTDPRVVATARRLATITFEEMLEMASLGSKVLHPRSVEFAGKYGVPLRVLSSFEEGAGTLITREEAIAMEQPLISGIAFARDEAKITVQGVPDLPGVASKVLGPVSDRGIEIDMIVQNVGASGLTDFTFTVKRGDYRRALEAVREAAATMGAGEVRGDDRIVKVSAVGVGMRSHAGVATRMFDALAVEGINIQIISTSEIKISVVIDEKYLELAVRAIHDTFGLSGAAAEED
ncbi:MAG: aspartate kinase [Gammaproteobacteria bacterium]|nr:aspartate kinase [Gammaproteobacteria bacterium]